MTTIKKYKNRKYYNTESSRYTSLEGIANMLLAGKQIQVVDSSYRDITAEVFGQIYAKHAKIDLSTLLKVLQSNQGVVSAD